VRGREFALGAVFGVEKVRPDSLKCDYLFAVEVVMEVVVVGEAKGGILLLQLGWVEVGAVIVEGAGSELVVVLH
jgi:hypothetical protein